MPTEINKNPETDPKSLYMTGPNGVEWTGRPKKPEPESILEKIPRLWATGKLYFMDDDGVVRPFPKPAVEEIEK